METRMFAKPKVTEGLGEEEAVSMLQALYSRKGLL